MVRFDKTTETDYQLTPFTTIQLTPVQFKQNSSSSSSSTTNSPSLDTTIVVISDLRIENGENTRSNIVCAIQFLCATRKEADEWCSNVQNNVNVLTMSMFESKLNSNLNDNRKSTGTESNEMDDSVTDIIQRRVVHDKIHYLQRNGLLDSNESSIHAQQTCCCGYLIRKNHIGSQFYLKPSIVFAILSPKHRQVIFHRSHEDDNIADVIACRVNALTERILVKEVEGNLLSISLSVENRIREVFVVSSEEQKQLWLSSMKKYLETESAPVAHNESSPISQKTPPAQHSTSENEEESDEDQDNTLLEGITSDGTGTMVIHGEGTVVIHDDSEPFSSMRIHKDSNWEEPNIFGRARGNIFQSSFWNEPEEEYSPSSEPSPSSYHKYDDQTSQIQQLQAKLALAEEECTQLRQQLTKSLEIIKTLQEENTELRSKLK